MRFHRPERVGSLIREELSQLILREAEFPGALITITDVVVDKKMDNAKVKISALPLERAPGALKVLNSMIGNLQHLLNKKMNIRPMPRISFEIDGGLENAAKVEKALLSENVSDDIKT
jgi:ribosome-binding factor A